MLLRMPSVRCQLTSTYFSCCGLIRCSQGSPEKVSPDATGACAATLVPHELTVASARAVQVLVIQGFLACRKHHDRILLLVSVGAMVQCHGSVHAS